MDESWLNFASPREIKMAAERGDAKAQCTLGWMYVEGRGVSQNYAEAARWWRKAAEQGNADAQCNLGVMYANGWGCPQNYAEAVKWFRMAAEQGLAMAQYSLGVMYDNGRGVPQDYAEAVKWYRKAAAQGDADAQNNLGWMYANGRGLPKDEAEAAKWYRKAAEQGNAEAQSKLDMAHSNNYGVPKDDAEAARWYRKAAGQGNAKPPVTEPTEGLRYKKWDYRGEAYMVTGIGSAFTPHIVIPKEYNGKPVAGICSGAFRRGCKGVKSVVVPDSITWIGSNAFQNCTGLTKIIIPDSVTSIGEFAFRNCAGLTEITIPGSVTSIGLKAFKGCPGLRKITFGGTEAQWNQASKSLKLNSTVPAAAVYCAAAGAVRERVMESPQRTATIRDAFISYWTHWTFKGRSSRADFFWMKLINVLIMFVLVFIGMLLENNTLIELSTIFYLVTLWLDLCMTVRRLHDVGNRSSWWFLACLATMPIGPLLVLLYWILQPSEPRPNRYGLVPYTER